MNAAFLVVWETFQCTFICVDFSGRFSGSEQKYVNRQQWKENQLVVVEKKKKLKGTELCAFFTTENIVTIDRM